MTNKRLLKEIHQLTIQQNSKPLIENDYIISVNESNINKIHTIIKGPYDSVYRHKFIKLDFDIPKDYPHSPPKVTFIFYDIRHTFKRIHPNFYEDGRCCSTILNTWNSGRNDKWTSSMGIETVLLTFQSFLDNNPYTYEPGDGDDDSYTQYVKYQTWNTCLLKYLENKALQPEIFSNYIYNYLLANIFDIYNELNENINTYPNNVYYSSKFEIFNYIVNYNIILDQVNEWFNYIEYTEHFDDDICYNTFVNTAYNCNICFDTKEFPEIIKLSCNQKHSFHIKCIDGHITNNGKICSLCRKDIVPNDLKLIQEIHWIINPVTNRRIKVHGKTYNRLVNENVFK